ncbi:SDR family NAD(P)-dependent oxidoreductase [Comamonadaceae bacterium G21597-S1]|nr:SDR family NAD(P)-dependent oxidoreductase [Comamonadaceae bacterium G21597-S1]
MHIDKDLVVIITGGASGLGAATARLLAASTRKIALFDLNEEKGRSLAEELGCHFFKVDITSDDQVEAAFEAARAVHGQERVLVNCAGIGKSIKTASRDRNTGAVTRFPMAVFANIINVNLIGTFRCIAQSASGMIAADSVGEDGERGVIITTGSVAAADGQIGQAAYSASKGGIVSLTLPIARDLMGNGIRVNTILPGIFDTPLMQGVAPHVKQALADSVPFPKRFGRPEEYASLAAEMIRNGYFNGETVRLDGAIRMAPR